MVINHVSCCIGIATEVQGELAVRKTQLEQAEDVKEANGRELAGLASDLEGLRGALERARRAAASVGL